MITAFSYFSCNGPWHGKVCGIDFFVSVFIYAMVHDMVDKSSWHRLLYFHSSLCNGS